MLSSESLNWLTKWPYDLSSNHNILQGENIWLDFPDEKSEFAKTNSLQPFDRLRAMSIIEWPTA